LLAFRAAAVVDLLRRVEQEVVRLRRAADVGEVGAEEEPELGEHRAAKGKDSFLTTLAVHAERAAVGVEVANLDAGELASPDAEEKQAEEREAVVRVFGDREQPWRASAGRSGATRFSARGRLMRAAGEIAIWPCSSAQLQKARTTDVTFCRVRGERSPHKSMTSRRSSTETSIGSLSASVRLIRASTAS